MSGARCIKGSAVETHSLKIHAHFKAVARSEIDERFKKTFFPSISVTSTFIPNLLFTVLFHCRLTSIESHRLYPLIILQSTAPSNATHSV